MVGPCHHRRCRRIHNQVAIELPRIPALPSPETHMYPISRTRGTQHDGRYAGFDESEFTCRSGGKPAAIRHIKVRVAERELKRRKWASWLGSR